MKFGPEQTKTQDSAAEAAAEDAEATRVEAAAHAQGEKEKRRGGEDSAPPPKRPEGGWLTVEGEDAVRCSEDGAPQGAAAAADPWGGGT